MIIDHVSEYFSDNDLEEIAWEEFTRIVQEHAARVQKLVISVLRKTLATGESWRQPEDYHHDTAEIQTNNVFMPTQEDGQR